MDQEVTLTATISYNEDSINTSFSFIARRYFSDLTDGVVAGYMYTSDSQVSNNTLENLDIAIFAFINLDGETGLLKAKSTIASQISSKVNRCHQYGTYAVLSVGILDNTNLGYMSTVVQDSTLRASLIADIVNVINSNNLDGIDIDWEFPASSLATYFTLFMQELRAAVKANNPYHLVMAATGIDSYTRYDFSNSSQYLDYICIMTYDMQRGGYSSHQAPLYNSGTYSCYRSVSNAKNFYVNNSGINPSKLILGIPFYGRKVTDTDGLGKSGTSSGAISYATIVNSYLTNENYTRYWDASCDVPYLYSSIDRTFVTYDDPESIALKCAYANTNGFAGMMYWQDGQDSGDTLFNAILTGVNDNW